jgi:hypothetical protein
LAAQLKRAIGRHELRAFQLELAGPIVIRYSEPRDHFALMRLAGLDSRILPEGLLLLVEVDGELVAAAPIDVDVEPLKDPFRPTANLRELLGLQAAHVRRHRGAVNLPVEAVHVALRDAA